MPAKVLDACLRAESQGLLKGDLNVVRVTAASVANAYAARLDKQRDDLFMKRMNDVVDLYLKMNFPKVYDEIEARREHDRAAADEVTFDDLSADSMSEMLDQMRRAAGML